MEREYSFNAYAVGNASDGKGLGNSAALARNYCAFKGLNSFTLTLTDFNMNSYSIADSELRNIFLKLTCFNDFKCVHNNLLLIRPFLQMQRNACSKAESF